MNQLSQSKVINFGVLAREQYGFDYRVEGFPRLKLMLSIRMILLSNTGLWIY